MTDIIEQELSPEILALKKGLLIIYPTEAVWGIGCDPKNSQAFDDLLAAKNRPIHKGVILIAANYDQLLPYVNDKLIPMDKRTEIFSSWPGAVTYLLPASNDAPEYITGGSDLIAVRITTHPTVCRICNEFGGAIVSTSANLSGQPTAETLAEVQKVFEKKVSVYVNEPLGKNKKPSKIINGITGEIIRS